MAKAGKNKQDTGYIDLFAEEEELSSEDFEETEDLFPQEKKARSGFSLFKQNKKQKKTKKAAPKAARGEEREYTPWTEEDFRRPETYAHSQEETPLRTGRQPGQPFIFGPAVETDRPAAAPSEKEEAEETAAYTRENFYTQDPAKAAACKEQESPPAEQDAAVPEAAADGSRETFSFDRYGRRTGDRPQKRRKDEYGRRKNARKASTTVITNETEAVREQEEARQRAQEREEIRQKQQRMQQARRKKQREAELKRRLSVLGVLSGLVLLVLAAAYLSFRIQNIDVNGTLTRYTAQEIVTMSGLKAKRHILSQNLDKARENLEADPYLNATVRYVFPNRIAITIKERKPLGAVQWGPNMEYLAIVDGEGTILESDADSRRGLPLVEGMIVTRILAGAKIGEEADEQVQSMLDILNGLEEYGLLSKIARADLRETMGISLYTEEGYRIEVGSAKELATKFTRLKNNWGTLMNKAAAFKNKGADNVTIYLYSKNGVTISPHELGYTVPTASPDILAGATPEMNTPEPQTQAPDTTPAPSDIPADTAPPYQGDPFLG